MNKKDTKSKKKDSNFIFGIINISIVIGLAALVIVLIVVSMSNRKKPSEKVERFKDITHISLEEYKAILSGETALAPKDYEFSDTYVFIYNPNYETCPLCGLFNDDIISKATKEDKTYNFYVLDITDSSNEGIKELIGENHLPNTPVLIHLFGSDVESTNIDELAIKSALANI